MVLAAEEGKKSGNKGRRGQKGRAELYYYGGRRECGRIEIRGI